MPLTTEEKRLRRNAYMRKWKQGNKEKANCWSRKWKADNRQKMAKALRKWRTESYENLLFGYARRSAQKSGREFSIELSDIVIPEVCPILGIPLIRPVCGEKKYAYSNRPSLDRRDNSKGYTKENIAVVSWRANRLKNDASVAEIEAILAYMRGG